MTTLFEEAESTNPPSPSLDLLDSSIKNDLDSIRKLPTSLQAGSLYAVGGGQLQQVITSSEISTLAAVAVDGSSQDGPRYTYYPAVQTSDANQHGQFYVMMSPQDVIPVTGAGQRIIAPRAQNLPSKMENSRSSRDERRRATHNEVERRRRDKINTWIMKLATVVPDCQMDQSKQGTSKGGVLSKALDHIIKLRTQNDRMADTIKEQERILVENQVLRQQVEKLRQDNAILQANLQFRHTEHMEHDHKIESD
ncbi:upstream stimulatory factor 2 [Hydra vulgaris]|uniref:Upstream stimulatory factor 2 n=1 Tax=Hydra vulgaris TaxID=6087 RepID=A0ABM4B832_HYDVU